MFIAVVGIAAGPSFVQGFKEVGLSLFIVGALATSIPLIAGILMAKYIFKFHPALVLGCTVAVLVLFGLFFYLQRRRGGSHYDF